MNHAEAIAWLYDTQNRGIKLGLENIRRLLVETGWEPRGQKYIHVAGTNGKGSVCAMIDSICRAERIRCALFTSPHLVRFEERIQIDGIAIGGEALTEALGTIRKLIANWETHPTFFEIATAVALRYFQQHQAELIVLETGLGGRMDATNVVTPLASVLTPIDLDHQEWLGHSLTLIAREKAGIIKPGVPVLSAPQSTEVADVIRTAAAENGSALRFINAPVAHLPIALAGSHQKWNAALSIATLEAAGVGVSHRAVAEGLGTVSWPARFQRVADRFVIDGAHNRSAAAQLALTWREVHGEEQATIVLGVLKDKDLSGICAGLLPIASSFIAVPVASPRTCAPREIRSALIALAAETPVEIADNFTVALRLAEQQPRRVLITGSLFLAGEAVSFFAGNPVSRTASLQ